MIIFAPLSYLKYKPAYLVWYICNLFLLLIVPFMLWTYIPNLHKWYPYLVIAIATFFPVFVAAIQGQDSILLLFLLTLCFTFLKDRKEFRAGMALAMGMFKFVLVIPIAFSLVVERRWRSLAGFATGCILLLLAATAIVGLSGIEAYFRLIAGFRKAPPERAGTESIMPNLRGFVHAVNGGLANESWLMAITLLASVAILILINMHLLKPGNVSLRFSAQVVLATLVSYHLYPHDASILILPLVLLLNHSVCHGSRTRLGIAIWVAAAAMYLCPFFTELSVSMPIFFCASTVLLVTSTLLREPLKTAVEGAALS